MPKTSQNNTKTQPKKGFLLSKILTVGSLNKGYKLFTNTQIICNKLQHTTQAKAAVNNLQQPICKHQPEH